MASLVSRAVNRVRHALFPGPVGAALLPIARPLKPSFDCPLCGYHGPFLDVGRAPAGTRHSNCPRCGSNERGRLQFLVMQELRKRLPLHEMTLMHFSPEQFLQPYFRKTFGGYRTAGIWDRPVDFPADLTALPFADQSCDFIFASHVLEHIADDRRALGEIRRVLKPGGIAVLPVPIVALRTVEYAAPNAHESGHVRAPGRDYYERYRDYFRTVDIWDSARFPEKYQVRIYEDRTAFPSAESPAREPMPGEAHPDFVPVCTA